MRFIIVALVVLGMMAANAQAGCAWVLWAAPRDNNGNLLIERYSTLAAFDEREACESELEVRRQRGRAAGGPPSNFLCLPDTVDPRAPKAVK